MTGSEPRVFVAPPSPNRGIHCEIGARLLACQFDTPPAPRYDGRAMNRLKLWLYMAVLLGAGAGNAYFVSRWLTHRAIAEIDRDLRSAAAQIDARSQLLAGDAVRLAEAAARAPGVAEALSPDAGGDAMAAMQVAVRSAAPAPPGEPPRPLLLATSGRGATSAHANGKAVPVEGQLSTLLQGAAREGIRREAHALVGDALYYVAAVPVGGGASLALGVPLDAAWLGGLRTTAGVDVSLALPGGRSGWSTLPAQEAAAVARAARTAPPGRPIDAGKLSSQQPTFRAPFPLRLSLLLASAPAHRVDALALKGLPSALLVLSAPTGPHLAPVATYVWLMLGTLALLLVLGLVLGLGMKVEPRGVEIPKGLLTAADRISRGDFSARAGVLAGSLGTIAAALNRAAAAAERRVEPQPEPERAPEPAAMPASAAPESAAAAPATTAASSLLGLLEALPEPAASPQPDASPEPAPPEPGASPEASTSPADSIPAASAFLPAPEPVPAVPEVGAGPDALPPASEPEPALAPPAQEQPQPLPADAAPEESAPPAPPPEARPPLAEAIFGSAGLGDGLHQQTTQTQYPLHSAMAGVAPAAQEPAPEPALVPPAEPAALAEDEEHWQAVFEDFIRVRNECGEPRANVVYERFRQKLQKNRDQLVAKYSCRTVRFQVYVKEGKAALKASPVR